MVEEGRHKVVEPFGSERFYDQCIINDHFETEVLVEISRIVSWFSKGIQGRM